MSTSVTPTILLRGIVLNKLVQNYRAGRFNRSIPPHRLLPVDSSSIVLAPSYSSNSDDPIFTVKDRHNVSVVVATAGHELHTVFQSDPASVISGICETCGVHYTSGGVGYPLAYEDKMVCLTDTEGVARIRIVHTFWVEGTFHSYSCALRHVRLVLARPLQLRDPALRDTENLLRLMHRLSYPRAGPLVMAKDPRLLKRRGGSLTEEEWNIDHQTYTHTSRVFAVPTKTEYLRHAYAIPASV
jgi:hypothetical protein